MRTTTGLVVGVALLLALAAVGIGLLAYEVTHEALEQQLDHRIAAETAGLLAEAHRDGLPALAAAITRREAARSTASLDYLLVDSQGLRLAGSMIADVPAKPGYEELLHYRRADGHEANGNEANEGIAQALVSSVPGGTLVVAADRADLDEIDRTLATLFASAFAALMVIGLVAAGMVGWVTRRRLSRIDATAQAIIEGDLARRVPRDHSGSEFDRLAATLNRMLDRIEGLMENLRQVSSDVAHDLRTPLTRLYGNLERAVSEPDGAERSSQLDMARAQAGELLEIFASLLRIAEIEGLSERLPRQRIDVSLLLEQMAETYRPDFDDSARTLRTTVAPGLFADGDRRLLSQALANLLDNALRHTPQGTTTELNAARVNDRIRIEVCDDGPGVTPTDRERLFNRFARGERTRSTPGNGLGLSMVKAIAEAHRGRVDLILEIQGFGVALNLPCAEN